MSIRAITPILLAATLLAHPSRAAELQLRRVTLSTAGIGYFEHEAALSAPTMDL